MADIVRMLREAAGDGEEFGMATVPRKWLVDAAEEIEFRHREVIHLRRAFGDFVKAFNERVPRGNLNEEEEEEEEEA